MCKEPFGTRQTVGGTGSAHHRDRSMTPAGAVLGTIGVEAVVVANGGKTRIKNRAFRQTGANECLRDGARKVEHPRARRVDIGEPLGELPTAECCQLLPSVRELLFAQERLEQTAAKVRGADCGTIVIGTAYNCYYEWVTQMMAAFRTRHPGVVIKIVNGTSSELAEMLLDHRTDFCLISHRDSLPVWLPIRQDELMVLLPKNHPLADRESFPVESLKTEPFIDSYPGMETDITLIFDKLKARPDARYSTMDITATYAMVSAGLGISVNNAINHQDGYPGVVERPMNPHQMMEIGLACGENLAPAAQAFLDFVKERLPE